MNGHGPDHFQQDYLAARETFRVSEIPAWKDLNWMDTNIELE